MGNNTHYPIPLSRIKPNLPGSLSQMASKKAPMCEGGTYCGPNEPKLASGVALPYAVPGLALLIPRQTCPQCNLLTNRVASLAATICDRLPGILYSFYGEDGIE